MVDLLRWLRWLLVAVVAAAASVDSTSSDYQESLLLRPLPQNALLASFSFRSNASSTAFEQQNFRYFPRSLGQILQHAHAKELHLRFSLGRWDAETWGARPRDGAREGGLGVELWAWVEADTDEEANARWLTLTNALSGLFCASLNFIDATRTIRPVMTFQPEGHHTDTSLSKLHLLHGVLPHEVVCTENLTPFLKLLPCKGKAGISSLFDGHKLFDAAWQTMSIDVRPVCPGGLAACILEMEQNIDMVLDIERSKRPRDNPIPRPKPVEEIECDTSKHYHQEDSCYPIHKAAEPAWSLHDVFGRSITGSCPLTSSNGAEALTVCVHTPPERTIYTTGVADDASFEDGFLRCFKPTVDEQFNLELAEQVLEQQTPLEQPRLFATRSITGFGQERGGVQAVITNPSDTEPVEIIYLESLPWFMKPYLHTLRASVGHGPGNGKSNLIQDMYYRPALDRERGTHLEVRLTIPPASRLTLTYDFEKAVLRYTEYPPDANRGFDVAPAVIRLLTPATGDKSASAQGLYIRTTSLLLPLPTPDFSMPYNVIILTSTVMALGFGSIFNILVRRFVGLDEIPQLDKGGLLGKIVGGLQSLVARFQAKGSKTS